MADKVERRLAATLSADVVGYSRLMGADEEGTLARLKAHRSKLIDLQFSAHRGRIVKLMGDGVLVEFASVVDAVRCAAAIQRGMAARNETEDEDRRIVLRIGINLSDIIFEGDDIHGDGVNVAARMEQLAEPGGICISSDAFRQARGKVELGFADLGEQQLKNIAEPVRAYRVLMEAEAAGTLVEQGTPKKRLSGNRRWAILAVAAVVIIAIAAGVLLSLEPWVQRVEAAVEANMALPLPDEPSIVVLPLENLSGDSEQGYLVDGIADTVITALSQTEQLFVVARSSTLAYKGRTAPVKQVAEEFGVQYVLEGSFQMSGESIRVNTRLIDALTGHQMWAGRYDRQMSEIFALQDDITANIVEELQIKLTDDEESRVLRRDTGSVEAFQQYMKARNLNLSYTPENNAKARALFEQAIALDPEYADARVGLAWNFYFEYLNGWAEDSELTYSRSIEESEKALAIDDTNAEAHALSAWLHVQKGEHKQALAAGKKAVTLEPGGAGVAAIYSMVLVQSGRPEEAIEWFNRSKRLDPYISPRMSWTLAEALRLLGRYDEMIEVSKLILQTTAHWLERPRLIYAYMKQGREEEARTHLQMMLAGYPERVQAWLDAVSPLPTPMYEEFVGVLREAGFPDPDNPAQLESEEFSVLPRSEYARAFSKNTES